MIPSRTVLVALLSLSSAALGIPSVATAAKEATPSELLASPAPPHVSDGSSSGASWDDADESEPLTPEAVNALLVTGKVGETTPLISLSPGEIHSVPVDQVIRVAIGDPTVVDVEVVSGNEILLQGKAPGSTNLMLWDSKGQRASRVEVASRIPETLETELRQLLNQLNLSGVNVHREKNKLFLTGLVSRQEDLERIEQMLAAFKDQVTNLVALSSMPSTGPPPSVKLTVQLIEMSRDAKDQFGVDWSDSLTFTETTFGAAAITESLIERVEDVFRIGTVARSGDAGSLKAVLSFLVSKNKARILAEPRLVAASGKEATTFLGLEVPVITTSNVTALGTVSQSIEFKNTGVELQFTPTVLEPDRSSIRLVISAKVSSIDKSVGVKVLGGETVPGFRVRQTQTEIVTASGASVLISGLLQDEEKKNISQVPAVGSIPVLGNLFRSTEFVTGQTELIVLVTSELLGGTAEPIADRSEILEQALSSAELAASVEDPSLRYALQVQDRIAKSIRYPIREKELSMGGRVKLRLHLFRDGTLGKALVTESSGIESLDSEAMKAAESQSPYPAFPSELAQQDLWLEVPVLFRP